MTEEQVVYATKEVSKGDINVEVEVKGILDSSKGSAIRIPEEEDMMVDPHHLKLMNFL